MSASQKLLQGLEQLGFSENNLSGSKKNPELSETEKLAKVAEISENENETDKAAGIAEKLDKYINELILFNSAYNLTNTSDYDEIVVNHILDSLSAANLIKTFANRIANNKNAVNESAANENAANDTESENTENAAAKESSVTANKKRIKIADIGSGGGLPGIPLAIVLPQFNFTLVERMDKRCAFLENEKAILGLKNVSVLKTEAEKIPPESFDIATFRAFRPLDKKMTKTLLSLTKKGGIIAAYKAKLENIKEEMSGIKNLVSDYKIFPLEVPFLKEHERNLVVIEK